MRKLALFVAVLALVFGGCAKKSEQAQTPATTDTAVIAAPAAMADTTTALVADTTKKAETAVPAAAPAKK
jgi:hypothetical protein